ncbi:MAG: VWA domain-containing protein [Bacteroidales bacterium]|nr:VWA domain-containing protein [Bacteroidales bacterium]
MQLANPQYLWLFLIFIPLIIWYVLKQRNARPSMGLSSTYAFASQRMPLRAMLRHSLFILRLGAIGCLIVILARPQIKDNWQTTSTNGTDIVLALDISGSMLTRDLKPNRLESAKKTATKFINGRPDDNIGIVIFAGESLTGMPMTVDHDALNSYIAGLNTEMLSDGTAIGDGIATSLNRIKEGKAKSKSIILLTDGSNNTGLVAPGQASEIAKNEHVKIYTIGIGTNGLAETPAYDEFGRLTYIKQPVVIDEATLQKIAQETGGKYFRATDDKTLGDIFNEIDRLEKTKMDISHFSHTEDSFMLWAWLLIGIFGLELILRYTVFRTVP